MTIMFKSNHVSYAFTRITRILFDSLLQLMFFTLFFFSYVIWDVPISGTQRLQTYRSTDRLRSIGHKLRAPPSPLSPQPTTNFSDAQNCPRSLLNKQLSKLLRLGVSRNRRKLYEKYIKNKNDSTWGSFRVLWLRL